MICGQQEGKQEYPVNRCAATIVYPFYVGDENQSIPVSLPTIAHHIHVNLYVLTSTGLHQSTPACGKFHSILRG